MYPLRTNSTITPQNNPFAYYDLSGGTKQLAPGMLGAGNPMGGSPMPTQGPMDIGTMTQGAGWGPSGGGQLPVPFSGGGMGGGGFNWGNFLSGGGGAGIGALLASLFGGKGGFDMSSMTNPANAASNFYGQIPGAAGGYYQPYIGAGKTALNTLMDQYGQLTSNPGAVYGRLGEGFQQSPGYQWQQDQALGAANRAASASGMIGTPAAQQAAATTASQLANQDFNNYMNRVGGMYNTGLQGYGNINQMGYNASDAMANMLANSLASQGQLAYQGADTQNQMNMLQQLMDQQGKTNMWTGIGGGISALLPLLGGAMGGPAGAGFGGILSSLFGR